MMVVTLRQVFSVLDILGGILLLMSTKFNKGIGIIMIIVGAVLLVANSQGMLVDKTKL
jgi:glucose uptake protein GlcU